MAKKGNLFALIKSLSKAEKRYFRLFVNSQGSGKNYLLLFDAIEQQEEYDEKALKEQFKGQAFIRQLHVTKIYLNKLILKSLRNFYSAHSRESELKDLLRDIEILFQKELYDQCFYVIQKAEKLSREYEKLPMLLEALAWQRKLLLTRNPIEKVRKEVNQILEEERIALEKLSAISQYWGLSANLFGQNREDPYNLKYLAEHELIKNRDRANTLQAKVLLHHIDFARFTMSNDLPAAQATITELIGLMEEHPERIKEDPTAYLTALNNQLGILMFQKRMEDIPATIAKIKSVPQRFNLRYESQVTIKKLLRTFNIELEIYRDAGDTEKGVALIDEILAFLEKHRHSVPENYVISFYYQFAYIYFLDENYSKSLHWLNRILGENWDKVRQDIQSYARFLNLVIHFELENIMVLKYAVDSTRRFLKKKRKLEDFEQILLRFFSKISLAGEGDYPYLFLELEKQLFTPGKEKMGAGALDYLDFKTWIDGKIPNRVRKPVLYPR